MNRPNSMNTPTSTNTTDVTKSIMTAEPKITPNPLPEVTPKPYTSSISTAELMGFIRSILAIARIKPEIINHVCNDPRAHINYTRAFTHPSEDPVYNYEMYEFLGDAIVNSSIVKYVYSAYPNTCMEHVQVLARLKILMASKTFMFKVSDQLGFRRYIKADSEVYETDIRSTMEDVFEAFFGCTYCMFNELYAPMSGDTVCYTILRNIFDTVALPRTYEDLVDPITRLKELMDTYTHLRQQVKITWTYDPIKRVHTGTGTCGNFKTSSTKYKKSDAHQNLSEQLLQYLAIVGYTRPVNPAFDILQHRIQTNTIS